jgi:ABC-type multidrug transport system ATPase subunit
MDELSGLNTAEADNALDQYPLVCYKLSKVYETANPTEIEKLKRKKALNEFSICLKNNEIFGLLG